MRWHLRWLNVAHSHVFSRFFVVSLRQIENSAVEKFHALSLVCSEKRGGKKNLLGTEV